MSAAEFGHFVLTIAALLAAVHGLGYISERLKQPRIVGEILAGIVLGPFVLKLLAPTAFGKLFAFCPSANTMLGFQRSVLYGSGDHCRGYIADLRGMAALRAQPGLASALFQPRGNMAGICYTRSSISRRARGLENFIVANNPAA